MTDQPSNRSETQSGNPSNHEGQSDNTTDVEFPLLRLLFYTRFSLLGGLALILLAFLPWMLPISTIQDVYIQTTPFRLGTLTLISYLAAALVVMTFRTTLYNAASRFNDPSMQRYAEETGGWLWRIRRFSWLFLGSPLPLVSLSYTADEIRATGMGSPFSLLLAMAGGFFVALLLLVLLAWGHRRLMTANLHDPRYFPLDFSHSQKQLTNQSWKSSFQDPSAQQHPLSGASLWIARTLGKVLNRIGLNQGYVAERRVWIKDKSELQLLAFPTVGHVPLTMFTLSLLALQLIVLFSAPWFFGNWDWLPNDQSPFGTLFYLVGLVMMFMGILPGVSFFLDRYRIPTSWVCVALFLGLTGISWLFPEFIVDHKYAVAPEPVYVSNEQSAKELEPGTEIRISEEFIASPLSLDDVIDGWAYRQQQLAGPEEEPNRTFVVVTAAGGGIQASGWTTTVLSGLAENEELEEMVSGIGVVSAVSGGSVGFLHFLTRYPELIKAFQTDDEELRQRLLGDSLDQSTRSSLEAVGWGLLFPDTWRNLGIVRNPTYDRGWVQEQVWADRMNLRRFSDQSDPHHVKDWQRDDWRLGHLAHHVKTGSLPAVVFNGFSTTTGQRIWMAPFRLRKVNTNRHPRDFAEFSSALGMQLKLSTAARISASFPYVSPTAIAHRHTQSPLETAFHYTSHQLWNSHLADGGYTDNEGLLTALAVIRELDYYHERHSESCPFDRVLLLRIAPFPVPDKVPEQPVHEDSALSIEKDSPYSQSVAGPALGLYRGRTVTQLERGDLEIDLFQNLFSLREDLSSELKQLTSELNQRREDDVENNDKVVKMMVRQNPLTHQFELSKQGVRTEEADKDDPPQSDEHLQFDHIMIDFRLQRNGINVNPPLSWKLNHQQKSDLAEAWRNWQQNEPLADVLTDETTESVTTQQTPQSPILSTPDPSHSTPVRPNLPTIQQAPNVLDLKDRFHGKR